MTLAPARVERVTSDPALAGEYTREAYGGTIDYGAAHPLTFRYRSVGDPQVALSRLAVGARFRTGTEPLGVPMVVRVVGGRYELQVGRVGPDRLGAGDAFLIDPASAVSVLSDHIDCEILTLDPALLVRAAAQLQPFRPRLAYLRLRPVDAGSQRLLTTAANHLGKTVFTHDELYANDMVRAMQYSYLAAVTIVAFGLLADEPDERPASEGVVHRAVRFADEHVAEPITVGDLAENAGVSLRALQLAFHRVLGVSPSAYIRRARLESARAELLAANAETATVGAVARGWGFVNLGRFAADYRRAFGELPHATLAR